MDLHSPAVLPGGVSPPGSEPAQRHALPYQTFVLVWAALVLLTGTLVLVSRLGQSLAVAGMLLITPLKAGLVFYFFMHLKYESALLRLLVFIALSTLLIFIALMFLDIPFRRV
jgi:cytochrome c oxidase subunit IV